jgi:hypothetical protein
VAEDELPPPPRDDWGRDYFWRGLAGRDLWARPDVLAEHHPSIDELLPGQAVLELSRLAEERSARTFLTRLHERALGPPFELDADRRWQRIRRDLEAAFSSGWLVLHAARPRGGHPGQAPERPPPPPPELPSSPVVLSWIEVLVLDATSRQPLTGESVRIVEPGGVSHTFSTDASGLVRLGGIDAGVCEVSFPAADGREWTREGQPFAAGSDAVRQVHQVQPRQCMARIADSYQFRSAETLWNHPANEPLKELRKTPDVLWPGDRVHILAREERIDEAETARRHVYLLIAADRWLRVILHGDFGEPMSDVDVLVQVGRGVNLERRTDGSGLLETPIPRWAETATLVTATYQWPVNLANILPVEDVPDEGEAGARRRLVNLGVHAAPPLMERAASTERADAGGDAFDADIWNFQRDHGLEPTGQLDEATMNAIVTLYGH